MQQQKETRNDHQPYSSCLNRCSYGPRAPHVSEPLLVLVHTLPTSTPLTSHLHRLATSPVSASLARGGERRKIPTAPCQRAQRPLALKSALPDNSLSAVSLE